MAQLIFTTEQLVVLDKALQQMPYYMAAPLISHINTQIQAGFDKSLDTKDTPSGATIPVDPYRGD